MAASLVIGGQQLSAADPPANPPQNPEALRQERLMGLILGREPKLANWKFGEIKTNFMTNRPLGPLRMSTNATPGIRSKRTLALVTLDSPADHEVVVFDPASQNWLKTAVDQAEPVGNRDPIALFDTARNPRVVKYADRLLLEPGSPLWANGMVLQAGRANVFWGLGVDGDTVDLEIRNPDGPVGGGLNSSYSTKVSGGVWRFELDIAAASVGPSRLQLSFSVKGEEPSFILRDVAIGDLWIFAGDYSARGPEVANESRAEIRYMRIPPSIADFPERVPVDWGSWSQNRDELPKLPKFPLEFIEKFASDRPIGIILASCGVARLSAWEPGPKRFHDATVTDLLSDAPIAAHALKDDWDTESFLDHVVYNAMLAPLLQRPDQMPAPFNPRGIVWFQGAWEGAQYPETDANRYENRLANLLTLISSSLPEATQYLIQLNSPARLEGSESARIWRGIQMAQFNLGNQSGRRVVPCWDLPARELHLAPEGYSGLAQRITIATPRHFVLHPQAREIVITDAGSGYYAVPTNATAFYVQSKGVSYAPATVSSRDGGRNLVLSMNDKDTLDPSNVTVRYLAISSFPTNGLPPLPFFSLSVP